MTYIIEEYRGGRWRTEVRSPELINMAFIILMLDPNDTIPRRITSDGVPVLFGRHPVVREGLETAPGQPE